jgi:hypothetical protein
MHRALSPRRGGNFEPLAVTLAELLAVIAEVTPDEDEIVATMLHMVETRRVRLITPALAY